MSTAIKLPFYTLVLLISFASVNAVLFTPALPAIAQYFAVTNNVAEHTIAWFLIGYALGQLMYGPFANRYGRKPALYIGIGVQIFSSLFCIMAGMLHAFDMLLVGRFLQAIGSGVGLKMTFTLVNECYEPKQASSKVAYLMLSFAITPGLGVAIGGILTEHYGWMSCFYFSALYGFALIMLAKQLPETLTNIDYDAFKLPHLIAGYTTQFKNLQLMMSGFLIGLSTSFVYIFAAVAPFIAMDLFGLSSSQYGMANMIPLIGMVLGSLCSAQFSNKYSLAFNVRFGVIIITIGSLLMLAAVLLRLPVMMSLFLPVTIIYFGLCFILANASTMAMQKVTDKAHGAAIMSFINMSTATLAVLGLGFVQIHSVLLPAVFIILSVLMITLQYWTLKSSGK